MCAEERQRGGLREDEKGMRMSERETEMERYSHSILSVKEGNRQTGPKNTPCRQCFLWAQSVSADGGCELVDQ